MWVELGIPQMFPESRQGRDVGIIWGIPFSTHNGLLAEPELRA